MLTDPALAELRALFAGRLSVSPAVLAEHGQSESLVAAGVPDAVIFPASTAEVAALAVFLCTDAAKSITGTILPMDGGWTAA